MNAYVVLAAQLHWTVVVMGVFVQSATVANSLILSQLVYQICTTTRLENYWKKRTFIFERRLSYEGKKIGHKFGK